jgi:hypothetical protein
LVIVKSINTKRCYDPEKISAKKLALCIDAGEYEGVSLFAMKIYEYLPDPVSEKEGFLRVIDEDRESYYYDAKVFLKVNPRRNGLLIPFMSSRKTPMQRTRLKAFDK